MNRKFIDEECQKKKKRLHSSNAGDPGLIPGQGTNKIPHAAWWSQTIKIVKTNKQTNKNLSNLHIRSCCQNCDSHTSADVARWLPEHARDPFSCGFCHPWAICEGTVTDNPQGEHHCYT